MGITSGVLKGKKETWLQHFTRFGLIAKGVVYCLMGMLTIMAALGLSEKKGDKEEAFKVVYEQPFGKIVLAIIAIGLLGYVTLRFFQTFADTDHRGNNAQGLAIRIGYGISAFLYLGLSIYAVKLTTGDFSNTDSRKFFVSKAMEYPWGEWLVGIGALIIIGAGINAIYKGATGHFMKKVKLVHSNYEQAFRRAGVIGYLSRGIVLGTVGYLFLQAAIHSNPQEAKGTGGAFDLLQHTFGNILMGLIAIGLTGYGFFMFVKARYQIMNFTR